MASSGSTRLCIPVNAQVMTDAPKTGEISMEHSDFHIGLDFWCGKARWRCTDVGTRTVVAIRIDQVKTTAVDAGETTQETLNYEQANAAGWFIGTPYAVAELVFDENDLEACSLERDEP
ncbi:hypothetical protein [Sinorhizobium meliloti]|uniref:hypothetical protein n=1 Tax=Rhizobium meliloti TaxID=382 RepID=UPI001F29DF46|nr:hypothetical protein [Sinorhizobium meliloti]